MRWKMKQLPKENDLKRIYKFAWLPKRVWQDDNKTCHIFIWFEPYELRCKWNYLSWFGEWTFDGFYAIDRIKK